MITLQFNFSHPFRGEVIVQKVDCSSPWCQTMLYDSEGKHDFEIPLKIDDDGTYKVILNWEFEGLSYAHESILTVKNGMRQPETTN